MATNYSGSARLLFDRDMVYARPVAGRRAPVRLEVPHLAVVLESLTSRTSLAAAYSCYRAARRSPGDARIAATLRPLAHSSGGRLAMLLARNTVLVCPPDSLDVAYAIGIAGAVDGAAPAYARRTLMQARRILDLTALSCSPAPVTRVVQAHVDGHAPTLPHLTRAAFLAVTRRLAHDGLLTIPIGDVDFGDLRRLAPVCEDFGFSRGTPIDRYYLGRFIEQIRDHVVGDSLEIGGDRQEQARFGFENATSYRILDRHARPGVDVVGDAHDANTIGAETLDSVVLFNVLEHCARPWIVVENVYRWLRVGGQVFCMVPNAQRVHEAPGDFWRLLPAAIEAMFAGFGGHTLSVFGSLVTTVAAMMGVAAEELEDEDLDAIDPDYPVATCIVAQKTLS